ncbi:hypothetical protein E2320_007382 [Naja naja]|nr:hypothetical protein E2320_007382 [Naja naja]
MSPGRQRPSVVEKCPATTTARSRQSPRILVVDIHPPHWDNTCHKLCEALENVFCLACSLTGSPRIPSFSLYVVQNQQECLLPFVVKLGALPKEGVIQPKEEAVVHAVLDGLQQFKQYTGQGMAGACLSSSSVEITILTSQPSRKVANQLDAGLQGIDLVSLHQLQVVEVSQRAVQELSGAQCGGEVSSGSGAWLKCDVQERFLSPAQLPAACEGGTAGVDNTAGPFWMAPGLAPRRLRVLSTFLGSPARSLTRGGHPAHKSSSSNSCLLPSDKLSSCRALNADGVCASVLFGLALVVRPTNCWQLSWDELETNQQNFQAACHCLRKRKWLLLAKYETWGGPDLSGGLSASSFQVLLPSDSCALLLRPLVARELLLPCSFPPLPADLPEAALAKMEGILGSLEFEASYDPLRATSHLYQALKRHLGRLPASRVQRWAPRQWPRQQGGRMHPSRARATVAPLQVALPPAGSGSLPLSPSRGKAIPESEM